MNGQATQRSAGFTLVELVVVIVILGIVAAFAAPRFFDDRTFLQRGYYDELVAALKYSQKLAVASGCPVRVVIDSSGYTASQQAAQIGTCDTADSTWPTAVALADGQVLAGTKPLGVTVSPPVTLTFDALGRTDLGADQSINVGPFAVTVRAASGFIQAP
jgi:MSHA pilin protein MshC